MVTNNQLPVYVYNQRLHKGSNHSLVKVNSKQYRIELNANDQHPKFSIINSYTDYEKSIHKQRTFIKELLKLIKKADITYLNKRIKDVNFNEHSLIMIKMINEDLEPGKKSFPMEGYNIITA